VINLLSSGLAGELLRCFPNQAFVSETVILEPDQGRRSGWPHADQLDVLISQGVVKPLLLSPSSTTTFESLVIGPAALTLDDGEAATIALALEHQGCAVIDERKAQRFLHDRFQSIQSLTTIGLFRHPLLLDQIGAHRIGTGIFHALVNARMSIRPEDRDWVFSILSPEQIAHCPSIPSCLRISNGTMP